MLLQWVKKLTKTCQFHQKFRWNGYQARRVFAGITPLNSLRNPMGEMILPPSLLEGKGHGELNPGLCLRSGCPFPCTSLPLCLRRLT